MNKIILLLRATIFWPIFGLSIITIEIILLFARLLPYHKRFRVLQYWNRFVLWWLKVSVDLDYKVKGIENIPDCPVLFMVKHSSVWETIAMTVFLPPLTWVLKKSILYIPVFGWGVAMMEPIKINRSKKNSSLKSIIKQGKQKLKNNISILIFPEGTRTMPNKKGIYKKGGAVLAIEAGVDIVPISHNAGFFWRKHQFSKNPGTIQVEIGKPITTKNKDRHQITEEVEEWIEGKLDQMIR
jgi:1-acyl-sn-glycerol-3-phosphate acyltransferase